MWRLVWLYTFWILQNLPATQLRNRQHVVISQFSILDIKLNISFPKKTTKNYLKRWFLCLYLFFFGFFLFLGPHLCRSTHEKLWSHEKLPALREAGAQETKTRRKSNGKFPTVSGRDWRLRPIARAKMLRKWHEQFPIGPDDLTRG